MKGYHNLRSTAKYFALIITAIIAATFIATVGFDAMHTLPVQVSVFLVILIDIAIAVGLWMTITQMLRGSVLKVANAIDKVSNGEEINIEVNHDGTEDIWNSLQKISERLSWYDGILNAVPFPIHVTDNDMKWTYMNKAFEQLMIDQGVVKHRKDGYGMSCSNAGANICNTQNCGIKQLLKGKPESYFDWCGMNCKQDTAYLKNKKGESVGFVEVVSDLTSILRVNSYIKDSVDHLAGNLDLLSNGNLDIDLNVKEADEYTADARKHFVKISDHLSVLKDNLNALRKDITMLVSSATEGKLDARADVTQHNGCFSDLIKGVNQTLEVIEAPLTEAGKVLAKMSVNDFTTHMDGQYQGTFHEFAQSINHVRERLLDIQDSMERIGRGDTERLDEFKRVGKRSENDKLMVACISSMTSIRELINQADMLATAAKNGQLDVRGDESKFEGGYQEIIKGLNQTMEAFSTPIEEAASVMKELSEGNLTVSMNGDYKGDYNNIKQSLNTTILSFGNILNDINSAASQVASGSNQVSNSAQALSQGSMEQASSIEELTASIEQIAAQTKQNAQHANEANEISLSAKQDAMRGNDQMSEMCRAMGDINESSTNISKIIKVIDDIAFQTNILALNAAVEAARAGQHGKGFAVVAEEVRTLAARSANAAKETTSLIEGSIERVQAGTKIANNTAQALTEIVDGVEKAAELVGNIAVASNEQALGIEQISQGIMQVSKVTQMNSATSQESAAASEELFSQAEVLNSQVARFKLRKAAYTGVNTDTMPSMPSNANHVANHVPKDANHNNEFHTGAIKHKPAVPKNIVLNDYGKY